MKSKLVNISYPCDFCGLTAEDNESPHVSCSACDLTGCKECIEDHELLDHEDEA